jgi:lipoyl(octanoyl) transferase
VPMAEVEDRIEANARDVFARDLARRDVALTTVAVVVRRGPEALCLRRSPDRGGFWQIVTGRIEPGETPARAAVRELAEETGLVAAIAPMRYEHAFVLEGTHAGPTPLFVREIVFIATVPPGSEVRLSGEHDESRWLPVGEAATLVRHAGHRRAIRVSESMAAAAPTA